MSPSLQTSVPRSWVPRLMRKKKNSWLNEKASETGRSLGSLLTVLKFHVLLKESLFLRLIVPQVCSASSTQTDCVYVCAQTHTWVLPTQNAANHVCTSRRERKKEGGKERRKFDKVLDREKKEEAGRCPYSKAVAMEIHQTIQTASATAAWRIFEWNKPPFYFSFPLQEDSLAMSNPLRPPPPLLFPATQSPVASKRRRENTQCL